MWALCQELKTRQWQRGIVPRVVIELAWSRSMLWRECTIEVVSGQEIKGMSRVCRRRTSGELLSSMDCPEIARAGGFGGLSTRGIPAKVTRLTACSVTSYLLARRRHSEHPQVTSCRNHRRPVAARRVFIYCFPPELLASSGVLWSRSFNFSTVQPLQPLQPQ